MNTLQAIALSRWWAPIPCWARMWGPSASRSVPVCCTQRLTTS